MSPKKPRGDKPTNKPIDMDRVREIDAELRAIVERYPSLRTPESQARLETWLAEEQERERMAAQLLAASQPKAEPTLPLSIRLPLSLIAQVDEEGRRMMDAQPGLKLSRADTLRMLCMESLVAHEKARKTK